MDIFADQLADLDMSVAYTDSEEVPIPITLGRFIVRARPEDEPILDLVADTDTGTIDSAGIAIESGIIEIRLDAAQMDFYGSYRYEISGKAGAEDLVFVSGYMKVTQSLVP